MKIKFLIAGLFLTINITAISSVPSISDAPIEWLITNTLQEKLNKNNELKTSDPLVKNIFKSINYNPVTDEIRLKSTKSAYNLKQDLIHFLNMKSDKSKLIVDSKYTEWKSEGKLATKVTLYKTKFKAKGFYYFNHIHTNLSQDNDSLRWLKISPSKTFHTIEKFLKRRRMTGTVAFTDHDTDKSFDLLASRNQATLGTIRGVEWGGKTHMCLVGIKKNWENLSHGREFRGEESIIQSRSSDGFRIVNHPNRKGVFPHTSWSDADGVEVWNTVLENSPFSRLNIKRNNNRDAFAQWTESLKKGKKHTAVAGSDFHFIIPCLKERSLMYPLNFIPAGDKTKTEQYLKDGRVSFSTRPGAPKLTLRAKLNNKSKVYNMGDKVTGNGNLEVSLYGDFSDANKKIGGLCYRVVNRFYRLFSFWKKSTWEIRFYNLAGALIAKREINPKWYNYKKHFRAVINLKTKGTDIIRAELWSVNKKSRRIDLIGATNPIFIN